jgi:hypothetical protein
MDSQALADSEPFTGALFEVDGRLITEGRMLGKVPLSST